MILFLNPEFGLTERRVGWRVKLKGFKGHVVSVAGTEVPDRDAEKMLEQNAHLVSKTSYSDTPDTTGFADPHSDDENVIGKTLLAMSEHDDLKDVPMDTLRGYAKKLDIQGIKANTSKVALIIALEAKAEELTA